MFKILLPAIFLMANAFGEFNISNIKLTPTELVIEGESLEDVTSLAIISGEGKVEFQVGNALSNKVIAYPQDNAVVSEDKVLKLVISDSQKEFTFPIVVAEVKDSFTLYKLQKKKEAISIPEVNSQKKLVLENKSVINFLPGDDFTGYDYNYSLYANPNGDLAIKGIDKDLFKIDHQGNVEISGTLKVRGRAIGYGFVPVNDPSVPVNVVTKSNNFTSANKVVLSAGTSKELSETGYTVPMNICPKGQILKSDGVNFICALESFQEEQLGPVYTNNKSVFSPSSINRVQQINNVIIDPTNNISGVVNFTASGDVTIATSTFKVTGGNVGIGTASPSVKLDVIGAANSGIRLKQGGQVNNDVGSFKNGMVFENNGDTKAVAIGYGVSDLFSITAFNGSAYNTLFTLNGTGNGVITGNLKIGAYTLPAADGASGTVLKTDGAGIVSWSPVSGGTVNGPGSTTVGNIASWNNNTGTLLADGGKPVSQLVTNASSSTNGFVAVFNGTSGQSIQNGTKLETDLVTGPASVSATDNLASYNNTTGKIIKDSGILSTNVMTMVAPALSGNILTSTGGKGAADSLVNISNVPTMAVAASTANGLILSNGTDKTLKSTAYQVPSTLCTSGQSWKSDGTNMVCSGSTAGDVVGPNSSNDTAIARFNGTTGKIIQDSGVLISAGNGVSGISTLSTSGQATLNSLVVTNNASAVTLATTGAATLNSLGVTTNATVSGTLGVAGQITVNNTTAGQFTLPIGRGTVNQTLITDGAGSTSWADNPQGDVKGPLTSTLNNVAVFADTTGKLIKDSGKLYTDLITNPSNFPAANRMVISAGINHAITQTPYTVPTANGTAGFVLTTDGAGVTSWSAPAGNVNGAASSTAGAPAIFADVSGKSLAGTVPYTIPIVNGTVGQILKMTSVGVVTWADAATGTGDVNGPGSSVAGNLASFNGTTGKIIQDSGIISANVVSNSTTSTTDALARYTGTGKVITDSVVKIDGSGNMTGVAAFSSTGGLTVGGGLTVTGAGSFSGALTAQSYTNTSDRNLKKDIVPFNGAADIVDQLVPVKFRWKKGDGKLVLGLIAQDVEKIIPEVVTVSKTKDGEVRSYDISQVLALTLEALKETREEVKKLQEKVKKLEEKKSLR